jgi:hypothetical protein
MFARYMRFSPKLVVGPEVVSNTFRRRQNFLVLRVNGERGFPWEENKQFLGCVSRGCSLCDK